MMAAPFEDINPLPPPCSANDIQQFTLETIAKYKDRPLLVQDLRLQIRSDFV